MLKMGFHPKWLKMIMECVSFVSYVVLVNESTQNWFKHSRGIRQGDPLSPYLFIICVEALTSLLLRADMTDCVTSFPLESGPLKVSHFFYANDSLIFYKANYFE